MNPSRMAAVSLWVCLFGLEAVRLAGADAPAHPSTVSQSGSDSQYVVFTLGGLEDVHDPAAETPFKQRLSKLVEELKETFHRTPDDISRFVGFSPGLTRVQNLPVSELEARVVAALDVAEETDMPVFFHLDDMHFCYDRADLFGDGESAEWSAFPKPGETHGPIVERYWLNWGQWVVFPAPVPCFESPKFRQDVANRLKKQVAQPVVARLKAWRLQGREYLFAGIAVGNETQVPDYRGVLKGSPDGRIEGMDVTQRPPRKVQMEPREMTRAGYHALQLRGHTQASIEGLAKEQGRDVQEVITTLLDDVAADYSAFRCRILRDAGVPREKIFTHTTSPFREAAIRAREQHPEMFGTAGSSNLPPPVRCAINNGSRPGFTVSRDSLDLPSLTTEIERVRGATNPDRRWAAVESYATTGQPGRPQTRQEYEQYLGSLLAHGATLVNVYGWNIPPQNPFAIVRDGGVVHAIQGWLRGDKLPTSWVNAPSEPLQPVPIIHAKMARLQQAMRQRQENAGDLTVFAGVMQEFRPLMEAGKIAEAEAVPCAWNSNTGTTLGGRI